jgi:hypothetical protein
MYRCLRRSTPPPHSRSRLRHRACSRSPRSPHPPPPPQPPPPPTLPPEERPQPRRRLQPAPPLLAARPKSAPSTRRSSLSSAVAQTPRRLHSRSRPRDRGACSTPCPSVAPAGPLRRRRAVPCCWHRLRTQSARKKSLLPLHPSHAAPAPQSPPPVHPGSLRRVPSPPRPLTQSTPASHQRLWSPLPPCRSLLRRPDSSSVGSAEPRRLPGGTPKGSHHG